MCAIAPLLASQLFKTSAAGALEQNSHAMAWELIRVSLATAFVYLLGALSVEAAVCHTNVTKEAFPNCQLLSPSYALHWNVSGDFITMAISSDWSQGYLAIGISEGGGMKGADIVVVLPGDKPSIQDLFSEDYSFPTLDPQQDWVLVSVVSTVVQLVLHCTSHHRLFAKESVPISPCCDAHCNG
jgi:DOMON domain